MAWVEVEFSWPFSWSFLNSQVLWCFKPLLGFSRLFALRYFGNRIGGCATLPIIRGVVRRHSFFSLGLLLSVAIESPVFSHYELAIAGRIWLKGTWSIGRWCADSVQYYFPGCCCTTIRARRDGAWVWHQMAQLVFYSVGKSTIGDYHTKEYTNNMIFKICGKVRCVCKETSLTGIFNDVISL